MDEFPPLITPSVASLPLPEARRPEAAPRELVGLLSHPAAQKQGPSPRTGSRGTPAPQLPAAPGLFLQAHSSLQQAYLWLTKAWNSLAKSLGDCSCTFHRLSMSQCQLRPLGVIAETYCMLGPGVSELGDLLAV